MIKKHFEPLSNEDIKTWPTTQYKGRIVLVKDRDLTGGASIDQILSVPI